MLGVKNGTTRPLVPNEGLVEKPLGFASRKRCISPEYVFIIDIPCLVNIPVI